MAPPTPVGYASVKGGEGMSAGQGIGNQGQGKTAWRQTRDETLSKSQGANVETMAAGIDSLQALAGGRYGTKEVTDFTHDSHKRMQIKEQRQIYDGAADVKKKEILKRFETNENDGEEAAPSTSTSTSNLPSTGPAPARAPTTTAQVTAPAVLPWMVGLPPRGPTPPPEIRNPIKEVRQPVFTDYLNDDYTMNDITVYFEDFGNVLRQPGVTLNTIYARLCTAVKKVFSGEGPYGKFCQEGMCPKILLITNDVKRAVFLLSDLNLEQYNKATNETIDIKHQHGFTFGKAIATEMMNDPVSASRLAISFHQRYRSLHTIQHASDPNETVAIRPILFLSLRQMDLAAFRALMNVKEDVLIIVWSVEDEQLAKVLHDLKGSPGFAGKIYVVAVDTQGMSGWLQNHRGL